MKAKLQEKYLPPYCLERCTMWCILLKGAAYPLLTIMKSQAFKATQQRNTQESLGFKLIAKKKYKQQLHSRIFSHLSVCGII